MAQGPYLMLLLLTRGGGPGFVWSSMTLIINDLLFHEVSSPTKDEKKISSPNPEHQQLNQLPQTPNRRSFNRSSKPLRKIPPGFDDLVSGYLVCGNDDNYCVSFSISIKHCRKVGVHTQKQALDYIGNSVKVIQKGPIVGVKRPLSEEALELLSVFPLESYLTEYSPLLQPWPVIDPDLSIPTHSRNSQFSKVVGGVFEGGVVYLSNSKKSRQYQAALPMQTSNLFSTRVATARVGKRPLQSTSIREPRKREEMMSRRDAPVEIKYSKDTFNQIHQNQLDSRHQLFDLLQLTRRGKRDNSKDDGCNNMTKQTQQDHRSSITVIHSIKPMDTILKTIKKTTTQSITSIKPIKGQSKSRSVPTHSSIGSQPQLATDLRTQLSQAGKALRFCKLLSDAMDLTSSTYTGCKKFSTLKQ
ncbi:hypothetical protein BY996DRAFT_6493505 [Phakopsora pachyrhizi]|nr:hypothetical protein BY996DRAFT_6493505 [Phakopsora pachyrhizi]